MCSREKAHSDLKFLRNQVNLPNITKSYILLSLWNLTFVFGDIAFMRPAALCSNCFRDHTPDKFRIISLFLPQPCDQYPLEALLFT